ncbi:MAG: hypothetical protein ACLFUY_08740 [Desulfobacterales bacterium]
MKDNNGHGSLFRTWVIITMLLVLIVAKGFFAFALVGDRGQPDWSYGTVKDVPASSPFAEYELAPHPQHVRGARGE